MAGKGVLLPLIILLLPYSLENDVHVYDDEKNQLTICFTLKVSLSPAYYRFIIWMMIDDDDDDDGGGGGAYWYLRQ